MTADDSPHAADESADSRPLMDRYYGAMRLGAAAESDMMALFADDAVYSEPFSGQDQAARGKAEVLARFRLGWEYPLPDLELDVLSMTIEGATAVTTWECRSPALPEGAVRGKDRYVFRDGLIASLDVTIDPTVEHPREE